MVVITCQRCTVFSFKIHFSHWRQELRYPARILKSIQTPWLSPFQEHLKRIKDLFARRGQEMTDSCLVAELHTWDYVSTSDWKNNIERGAHKTTKKEECIHSDGSFVGLQPQMAMGWYFFDLFVHWYNQWLRVTQCYLGRLDNDGPLP